MKFTKKLLIFSVNFCLSFNILSQGMTVIDLNIEATAEGEVTFGDFDNDNDLDILITGISVDNNTEITFIYENINGEFPNDPLRFMGMRFGRADWTDFDNDNDLDFSIIGSDTLNDRSAKLYKNIGGVFEEVNSSIIGMSRSDAKWADFNKDGNMDYLTIGRGILNESNAPREYSFFYYGDTFTRTNEKIPGFSQSALDIADMDLDGDPDLLVSGYYNNQSLLRRTFVYRNDGGNKFVEMGSELPPVSLGDVKWININNDKYLDIIVSGFKSGGAVTDIFINNQGSSFSKVGSLTPMHFGELEVADLNNDSFEDIVIVGIDESLKRFGKIYLSDGKGGFVQHEQTLAGLRFASVDLGDYDNDNDTDILVSGELATGGKVAKIYRNDFSTVDQITKVSGLQYVFSSDSVLITWSEVADMTKGYNFYMHEIGKEEYLFSPESDTSTGYLKNPNKVFLRDTVFGIPINKLDIGRYKIGVQTINQAGVGSDFRTTMFEINPTAEFQMQGDSCVTNELFFAHTGRRSNTHENAFYWTFEGATQTDSSDLGGITLKYEESGDYVVSLVVESNGLFSDTVKLNFAVLDYPGLDLRVPESVCAGETITVQYLDTTFTQINWDFDGATMAIGSDGGPYEVAWSNDGAKSIALEVVNGNCYSDTTMFVTVGTEIPSPKICAVRYDEDANANKISWPSQPSSVSSFAIFKESNEGEFELLDYVQNTSEENEFLDLTSTPNQQRSLYKLTFVDSCGLESPQSSILSSLLLTASQSGDDSWILNWTAVAGVEYQNYTIFRAIGNGDFYPLTEISNGGNIYVDSNVPTNVIRYKVGVFLDISCDISDLPEIESNIINTVIITSRDEDSELGIYPNPVEDVIKINSRFEDFSYVITDLSGKEILNGISQKKNGIDLSSLNEGIYILNIYHSNKKLTKKFYKN